MIVWAGHWAWPCPGCEGGQHGKPQAEHVDRIGVLFLVPNLGRCKGRGPEAGLVALGALFGFAKVADGGGWRLMREYQQVLGANVPVHDACGMEVPKSLQHLAKECQPRGHGHLVPCCRVSCLHIPYIYYSYLTAVFSPLKTAVRLSPF